MENLAVNRNFDNKQELLFPMMDILDKKNITTGVFFLEENEKLYLCFDKTCLSDCNRLILENISNIYNLDFFHSDDKKSPNFDRLEYWCPDEFYDEEFHVTSKCREKRFVVLELAAKDKFKILGTSIMLANCLFEQDPLALDIDKDNLVLTADLVERHDHYVAAGSPDLGWIQLNITLDKENKLRDNPYATFMRVCAINSPLICDNVVLETLVGFKEKVYVNFNMDEEVLKEQIRKYFEKESVKAASEKVLSNHEVKQLINTNK